MTTTQINYWNMKENQRHNIATEKENVRHNKAGENETVRHDKATESLTVKDLQIKSYSAKENKRHNLATEALTARDIDEKIRHNKAYENLTVQDIQVKAFDAETRRQQAQENARHNAAVETESARHNVASEQLTDYSNKTDRTYKQDTIKNEVKKIDIEHMFKSAKSVTDFANMLDNVGLSVGAKIYAVEELLLNPNISKDSKQELMKFANKLYSTNNVGMTTVPKKGGGTKKVSHPNVQNKFTHH